VPVCWRLPCWADALQWQQFAAGSLAAEQARSQLATASSAGANERKSNGWSLGLPLLLPEPLSLAVAGPGTFDHGQSSNEEQAAHRPE